jgi:Toprim-like/CHC2 zinc finger
MTKEAIQNLKGISIESYLTAHGHEPQTRTGGSVYFHSPFRSDRTPSFVVNLDSNTFKDFAESEKPEDIIKLVQRLHGLSFGMAIEHLANWQGAALDPLAGQSFFSNGQRKEATETPKLHVTGVYRLNHIPLVRYVQSRCISQDVAKHYLREVYFRTSKGNIGYGVSMQNDLGGFNVRSEAYKFKTGLDSITTISGNNNEVVNLFEGQFDFLSACTFSRALTPHVCSIVLNSTTNLKNVLFRLKMAKKVNCFLDNDTTGRKSVEFLKNSGVTVHDYSEKYYPNHKDFNEMIINHKDFKQK